MLEWVQVVMGIIIYILQMEALICIAAIVLLLNIITIQSGTLATMVQALDWMLICSTDLVQAHSLEAMLMIKCLLNSMEDLVQLLLLVLLTGITLQMLEAVVAIHF